MFSKKQERSSLDFIYFIKLYWDKVLLTLLITLYIVIFSTLSILRHDTFSSYFDLSNMDMTLWYTLHGHFFSLRNPDIFMSRLSVHADFILILLAPLYWIWDNVRILLISQAFFLGIGAIPAYLLANKILKNKIISLAIVLAYLLNPSMEWSNMYDFHGVTLVVPFFLFAFYFAYIKKWRWYWLFVFLALLTKENQSLNLAMMGIPLFFVFKEKKIGVITFVLGIVWFIAMVYYVMPYFSPHNVHWALEDYDNQIIPDPVLKNLNPYNFIHTFLLDQNTLHYYSLILKPFAFLPLIGLPWIVMGLPSIAINILRGTTSINLHYGTGLIPSLVIATIFAFLYLKIFLNKFQITKKYSEPLLYSATVIFIIIALRFNYHYSPLPTTPSCWCSIYTVTKEDTDFENALQNIPKDASVTSSIEIRPHINHRELAFSVPSATQSAQFIALITQNRLIGNFEPKDYENKLIPTLLNDKNDKLLFRSKHFYLFKKVK